MRRLLLLIFIIPLCFLFSCSRYYNSNGSGNIVTGKIDYTGFTEVIIEGDFIVNISQGTEYSVIVRCDDNLLHYVHFNKNQEKLTASIDYAFYYGAIQPTELVIDITMPVLESVLVNSYASRVNVSSFSSADSILLTVRSGSELNISDISADSLKIDAESSPVSFDNVSAPIINMELKSADIKGSFICSNLSLSCRGNIKWTASGSTDRLIFRYYDYGGICTADLGVFTITNADVTLEGDNIFSLDLSGNLYYELSGNSILKYRGTTSVSGSIVEKAELIELP